MGGEDRLDLLADPAVRSALGALFGRAIEHHARIGSTQDRALELAIPVLVVAEEQTAGRGRHDRTWAAPAGTSLLASWTFRPMPADPALFSLLAGVAVARALETLGVPGATVKWPNDVLIRDKKVAGVLANAVTDGDVGTLVLGIGVNVRQRAADLGPLVATATSLAIEGHGVDRLALLARVDAELRRIEADAAARRAALDEWRRRSATLGHQIEVRALDGSAVRGLARELADDGALVLETAGGARRVIAGEVA